MLSVGEQLIGHDLEGGVLKSSRRQTRSELQRLVTFSVPQLECELEIHTVATTLAM